MRILIARCRTATIINKAAVAAEKLIVKAVVSTIVAAAVFVKHAPAELIAAVKPRRIADACNRAPAVDFDIAVHVILAGVAVYGGKGFNAVAAVAA